MATGVRLKRLANISIGNLECPKPIFKNPNRYSLHYYACDMKCSLRLEVHSYLGRHFPDLFKMFAIVLQYISLAHTTVINIHTKVCYN